MPRNTARLLRQTMALAEEADVSKRVTNRYQKLFFQ